MGKPLLVGESLTLFITRETHDRTALLPVVIRLWKALEDQPILEGHCSVGDLGHLLIGAETAFIVTRSWLHSEPDPPPALVPPTDDAIELARLQRLQQGVLALRKEVGLFAPHPIGVAKEWVVRRLTAMLAGEYP